MCREKRTMDESSPLGVYLVKSGSKGDRLLFRYPYSGDVEQERFAGRKRKNPYALIITEDPLNTNRTPVSSEVSKKNVVLISDKALSNLFAVKSELCNQKFELKVNDVRFVGHPMQLYSSSKRDTSTILMFSIVFALKANASHDIVDFYHDFSHKIALALRSEERRCGYLSMEAKAMLAAHDEVAALPEDRQDSPYYLILRRSQLARDLQKAYNDLNSSGSVHLRINKWIDVSFCLPHKVHKLTINSRSIDAEAIQKCLTQLRPYHSVLLLVDSNELVESLPMDSSSALVRLIRMSNATKSLIQLAADADLTLQHVYELSAHLVYWAKATIIYPLCENNCYVLSPGAPTRVDSVLIEKFAEQFPGISLPVIMSDFSLPTSLSQWNDPLHLPNQRKQKLQIIIWMLQQHILMQLHTYVYLVPTEQPCTQLISRPLLRDPSLSHRPATSQSDFSGSLPSEDSVVGSPSQSSQSSKCGSDEDLSPLDPAESDVLAEMTVAEKEAIMKIPAFNNVEDKKLFLKLCSYFRGKHHLEEIMYYENVRRSNLLALLDKFRHVLVMCQHEDPALAVFYR